MTDTRMLYEQMKAAYCEATGFAMDDGADLAVRLLAFAAQLESLYRYADWCVEQAFPQTAVGAALDRHGALRGLTRNGGSHAVGSLRFSLPAAREIDTTVPAGTVCMTAGLQRYETTADAVISAGATTADALARACEPGSGGNTAAGTVTVMTLAPTGVTAVTNPEAFAGGSEAETDEHFRTRILQTYRQLPNGANAAWYQARAMDHDGVAAAVVQPRVNGIGTVGVVIAALDGAPSAALLEEVRADLQSAREIAVDVTVSAPEVVRVNITARIRPADGWTFADAKTTVEAAIRGLFSGERLGKGMNRARIVAAAMATGAVENCTLTAPSSDRTATAAQLLLPGTVTITEEA